MINIIVAIADNNIIGYDSKTPWHLPGDLPRFKKTTMGHPVVMGRKTYESIGRPLPGRDNFVLSRNPDLKINGVTVATNLDDVFNSIVDDEVFVIGGEQIYRAAMWYANRLYITRIFDNYDGDTFFPVYNHRSWSLTHHEWLSDPVPHAYQVYDRVNRIRPTDVFLDDQI